MLPANITPGEVRHRKRSNAKLWKSDAEGEPVRNLGFISCFMFPPRLISFWRRRELLRHGKIKLWIDSQIAD